MSHIAMLAEFVAATKQVPSHARAAATRCVLDLVTASLVGLHAEAGVAAREAAAAIWGPGRSDCWFGGPRLTVAGASYANAAIASALDLDDGHRVAAGHPGAAIIPAVLAQADAAVTGVAHHGESAAAESARLLDAVAIGYEIGVRIGGARDLVTLDTTATGRWCGQGVAAALGWMRGLPASQIAHAIGLAASSAPNLNVVGFRTEAGHLKEGIPWAAATGVSAVEMAAAGMTGSLLALDDTRYFDGAAATRALGETWLVETSYYKPYSVCRWAHAALDALDALLADDLPAHDLPADAIERIEVHTFSRALTLSNQAAPAALEGAQYSIPFAIALRALRGRDALLPMRAASLRDAPVVQLAERISLHVDPVLDAMFSVKVPARVVVHAAGHRWESTVLEPLGEPANPMHWDQLLAKLQSATRDLLDGPAERQLLAALDSLQGGDLGALRNFLRRPVSAIRPAGGAGRQTVSGEA